MSIRNHISRRETRPDGIGQCHAETVRKTRCSRKTSYMDIVNGRHIFLCHEHYLAWGRAGRGLVLWTPEPYSMMDGEKEKA